MKIECCECKKLIDEDNIILKTLKNNLGHNFWFPYCKECHEKLKEA